MADTTDQTVPVPATATAHLYWIAELPSVNARAAQLQGELARFKPTGNSQSERLADTREHLAKLGLLEAADEHCARRAAQRGMI